MTIAPEQFADLTSLLKRETAVVLETGKEYLVETRLAVLAREEGLSTVGELVDQVLHNRDSTVATKVLYALTTAETSFFRDPQAFKAIQSEILPSLLANKNIHRPLSLWSAACASGQEVYTLAIIMRELVPALTPQDARIIGTDINPGLITRAEAGEYTSHEVNRGLPANHLVRYFEETPHGYRVNDELRGFVEFSQLNLIKPLPTWRADLVLLRNVLIYFDERSRTKVLKAIHSRMSPSGMLVMGTAENATSSYSGFAPANIPGINAFYRA